VVNVEENILGKGAGESDKKEDEGSTGNYESDQARGLLLMYLKLKRSQIQGIVAGCNLRWKIKSRIRRSNLRKEAW
jgi:hypothetical protein